MSLQYYDSANDELVPIAGNVNPSDVIELKATKADKTQISNPNLLDNPWFTINQRGQSSYTSVTSSVLRSVDRWISRHHTNVTVNADGTVTFTEENDSTGWFAQRIESERIDTSKNYTFSFMLQNGTIYYATGKFPSSVSSEDYPVTDNYTIRFQKINDTYSQIVVLFSQNSSITVKAVKLELGSISTLAMDTEPNYATELLKCQRYFVNLNMGNLNNVSIGYGCANGNTSIIYCNAYVPIIMRTSPTISLNGEIRLHGGGQVINEATYTPAFLRFGNTNFRFSLSNLPNTIVDHVNYYVDFAGAGSFSLSADL